MTSLPGGDSVRSIVTGDRYLDLLAAFIDRHATTLLDGSLVLKLNPVALHYLQSRLSSLGEVEALKTSAPVDYLRAYVSDLGDYRKLEKLRRFTNLLEALKVVSLVNTREPTPVSLLSFSRLRVLEFRGCDLSTSPARGLLELRPILEKLICLDSTDALRHLFVVDRAQPTSSALPWPRLSTVVCASNGLQHMDDSLLLLIAVEQLDLSRNRFASIENLHACRPLRYLNLGFNSISSLGALSSVIGKIRELVLCNNELKGTRGLEKLYGLESLDLSYNLISSVTEVARLASLPRLTSLRLQGNPLAFLPKFRSEVLSHFPDPTKMRLDGKQPDWSEHGEIQSVLRRWQQQRTPGGAYMPAPAVLSALSPPPTPPDPGGTLHKKRLTRIAQIDDVDGCGNGGLLDGKAILSPSPRESSSLAQSGGRGGGLPMPPRSSSPSPLPGTTPRQGFHSGRESPTLGTDPNADTWTSAEESGNSPEGAAGGWGATRKFGTLAGAMEQLGLVGSAEGSNGSVLWGPGMPAGLSPRWGYHRSTLALPQKTESHLRRMASEVGSDATSDTSGAPWSDSDDDLDTPGLFRNNPAHALSRPPSFLSRPSLTSLQPVDPPSQQQ